MSTSLTKCVLFGALIGLTFQATLGANISSISPDTTRVVGSSVNFQATIGNVSANSTFEWTVDTSQVANVTIFEGGITDNVTSAGYALSVALNGSDLSMTLTIQNVTSSLNNTVVMVMGDGASANSTLTVLAGCGAPPTGSGCETYNCASNSSTYIGSMMGSVNTYNCYNTTTCGADGLWTALTTKCGTTAVGCQETNTWGASCNMTCGVGCLVARKCSFVNGSCLDAAGAITTACKPGYTGNTCSSMSVNCTYGKWGMNCNKTCGAGCRYSCDRTSGQCLNQQGSAAEAFCMPGYKGPKCDQVGCQIAGVYGPQCDLICGKGCPFTVCDFTTGACLDNSTTPVVTTQCITGYEGTRCETPICPGGCNGGVCFFPNYCGNCPNHFAQLGDFSTGVTCRNIRLDGFLKGSLPTFAILTVIVILLTVSSKWYIRRKLKLT